MTIEEYKNKWSKATKKQIEKELLSWRKYIDKHSSAYSWHGTGITPPGNIADGDKVTALKEILLEMEEKHG